MAEQSYIFDFSRVPSFFEHFNIDFNVADMDGSNNYELVWVAYGDGTNIDDYLNSQDGTLASTVTVYATQSCGLDWVNDEFGDATIELHDAVEFSVGDNTIPLKAIFLRDATTGYVMGYCINNVAFTVTNKAVFDEDVIFWDITRLNNGG